MKILLIILLIAKSIYGQHFSKIHLSSEIQLDSTILLANIDKLDVDDESNLLVTDFRSQSIILFDKKGKLVRVLNPTECHPGFTWNPYYAKFADGYIIVLNSIPWGFKFNNDGTCLGDMDVSFVAPFKILGLSGGKLLGYFTNNDKKQHLSIMDSSGKEIKRFGIFPEKFANLIDKFEGGGIVEDSKGNIYQLNVSSPVITKYDREGNFIKEIGIFPHYYKKIEEDPFFNISPSQLFKAMKKIKGKSLATDLFLYHDSTLVVLIQNWKKVITYNLEIYSTDGKHLNSEDISTDFNILAIKNKVIYSSFQPKMNTDGSIPNPFIRTFTLK